jgi:surface-adhesin protein E
MRRRALLLSALLFLPGAAYSQSWKEIGKTKALTVVLLDTKSIKRMKDTVTVTSRARFAEPDGRGVTSVRTIATYNCVTEKFAVKENDSYIGDRQVEKKVPKLPGYGVVFGGSATEIVYRYVCPAPKKP